MTRSTLVRVVSGTSLFVFLTGLVVLGFKGLWSSMVDDEDPNRPWFPVA